MGMGDIDDYLATPHIASLVADTQPAPVPNAAAGITGTIHGIMSSPLNQDTSKYDGSAPITQSQSDALPRWQQTHTIIPDAAIPPPEADPAYINRLRGTRPLPGCR